MGQNNVNISHLNSLQELERPFKIKSHMRLNVNKVEETESLLDHGNIMIGTFRLSRNYFHLKPGEPYIYDKKLPYIHARSGLPASHSVMVIGHGKQPLPLEEGTSIEPPCLRHVHIQNSEGKRFGVDGFGRISRASLSGLYWISLPPPVSDHSNSSDQ